MLRDAFPGVTKPRTVPADEAGHLHGIDEVLGIVVNGKARAYPITMLAYHHVVNDMLGGRPVLVTYCVLCSSGVAFDPVSDGTRLLFGMEGSWRGTATMYDRSTESLWLQLTGESVAGQRAGTQLETIPTWHTTWRAWRAEHPTSDVMAFDAENLRPGERYMSRQGARSGSDFMPPELEPFVDYSDTRLGRSDLLFGLEIGSEVRAYPFDLLARRPVIEEELGDRPITVWFDPDSRSAVAYERTVDGRTLTFRLVEERVFMDEETRSRWRMDGRCASGPLAGKRLRPVRGSMSEWYGWVALHPTTTIHGS